MQNKKTGEIGWHEYVPAESQEEAQKGANEAVEELSKENDFYQGYKPVVVSSFMPLFNGGETPEKWKAYGFSEGKVPDQYISACAKGAINLHIFRLGSYRNTQSIFNERRNGCFGCKNQQACSNSAHCAGEQSEP
jgi:hypothetical protein